MGEELLIINKLENDLLELKKTINGHDADIESTFIELLNRGLTVRYDNKLIRWYDKDGQLIISQYLDKKLVVISYVRFWEDFRSAHKIYYKDVKSILTGLVNKHFGIDGYKVRHNYE